MTLEDLTGMLDMLPKFPRQSRYYTCNANTYKQLVAKIGIDLGDKHPKSMSAPFWGVEIIVDPHILTDGEFRDDQGRVVTS